MKPWEDIFGETPASFASSVQSTLAGLEEKPMRNNSYNNRTGRRTARTAVLIAAAAVLLTTSALAVAASSGFLQSVFGSKGWEDSPGMIIGDDVLPAKEWAEVDEQTVQTVVGKYVNSSGMSIQAGDYIFTVDNYFLDENGFGAVSYTLKRSDGGTIPGYRLTDDGYSGQYVLDDEWLLSPPMLFTDSGAMLDRYDLLDKNLTTDTELHGILYIESLEEIPEGDHIYLYMNLREKAQLDFSGEMMECSVVVGPTERIELPTDTRVPTQALTNGEYTIWLSPISMMLDAPISHGGDDFGITIHYADGSEYVVTSTDPYTANIISGGYISYRYSLYYMFNRLVDVDNVVSLTIGGTGGINGTYMPDANTVRSQEDASAEAAYQEYLMGWLEETVESRDVTDEQLHDEFVPAITHREYDVFFDILVGYGLADNGLPMTHEEFIASYSSG